jgi:TRAP transporter 4TM/12TM fusion protein
VLTANGAWRKTLLKVKETGYHETFTEKLVVALAVGTSLYHLFFISGVFQRVGLFIHLTPHFAISLGLLLVLAFLLYPAKAGKPRNHVPWYDFALAAGAVISCGYHVLFPDLVLEHIFSLETTLLEAVLMIVLLIVLMEAVRRTIGIGMVILAATFMLYVFISDKMPGVLSARPINLSEAVTGFYLGNSGIFSIAVRVYATIIFPFVLFSSFLQVSGAGKFFVDLALSLTGSFRGGPAKVAVVASGFFGSITGSTAANVATTGAVTIPMMKQIGYKASFAGAVEAVASNGGQLMPPVMGVVAFVMAEITGVSYFSVIRAALLPALLYFIALFVAVHLEAVRADLRGLAREDKPPAKEVLKRGWYYSVPIIVLLYCLGVLMLPAEVAAIYAIIAVFFASMLGRDSRIGPKRLVRALDNGARTMLVIGPASGLVGVILGAMNASGIGITLAGAMTNIAAGNKAVLLMIAACLSFLMGMGMGALVIYMTLAALVAPVLIDMGVHFLAAHLFIFYWGVVSLITPPVCIGAFVAAGIAKSHPMKTGWQATRLGIATFIIPFAFVYSPVLLLEGALLPMALAIVTGVLGAVLLSIGTIGYFVRSLNWLQRLAAIASATLLIYPERLSDAAGLVLAAIVLFPQLRTALRPKHKKCLDTTGTRL